MDKTRICWRKAGCPSTSWTEPQMPPSMDRYGLDSKIDQWMKVRLETNIQLSFFVFQFKLKYKKISNKGQEVNIYFWPPIELPKTIISLHKSPKYVHAACKQFKTIIHSMTWEFIISIHLLLARSIHTGMQTDVNLFNSEPKESAVTKDHTVSLV